MAWILFENTFLHLTKVKTLSATIRSMEEHATLENDRCLQLSDVRIPLAFVSRTLLPRFSFYILPIMIPYIDICYIFAMLFKS